MATHDFQQPEEPAPIVAPLPEPLPVPSDKEKSQGHKRKLEESTPLPVAAFVPLTFGQRQFNNWRRVMRNKQSGPVDYLLLERYKITDEVLGKMGVLDITIAEFVLKNGLVFKRRDLPGSGYRMDTGVAKVEIFIQIDVDKDEEYVRSLRLFLPCIGRSLSGEQANDNRPDNDQTKIDEISDRVILFSETNPFHVIDCNKPAAEMLETLKAIVVKQLEKSNYGWENLYWLNQNVFEPNGLRLTKYEGKVVTNFLPIVL